MYGVRVAQTGCVGDLIAELRRMMEVGEHVTLTPVSFSQGRFHTIMDLGAR